MFKSLFLSSVLSIIATTVLFSQEYIYVSDITFKGNKKTKDHVIERELNFGIGDSILLSSIDSFAQSNNTILSSIGLFNKVNTTFINSDENQSTVCIEVIENWYLYPTFIFDLADRNFSAWWKEQNRSLDRINYGVRCRHYNLTGNKDSGLIQLQFGYTRKIEFEYSLPYVHKEKNIGYSASVFMADNREIPYLTSNNKPLYYKHDDERIMLKRFRASFNIKMRPSVEKHHSLRFEFHRNWVDEFVLDELNPNYFIHGNNSLRFFLINYDAQYDKRISYLYPYNGYRLFFNIKKEGLGIFNEINNLPVSGGGEFFKEILGKIGFGTKLIGKTNLIRNQQAFANNTGLGWSDDLVVGYDLYVLDGIDYFLAQNHLKRKLLDFNHNFNWPKILPDQFKSMNVQLHLRLNFDFAYVNEPSYIEGNTLNNRWIYGYGPAIDLILYNSFLFTFEYSFNDLGEHGLFINTRNSF